MKPQNSLPEHVQLVLQDAQSTKREAPVTWMGMGLSSIVHIGIVLALVIGFILIDLFNFDFKMFDLPEINLNKQTTLEYVIVNNTRPETSLDKKTKNRAEVASRSGGVKTKATVKSEVQTRAGGKASQAQQAQRAGTPTQAVAPVQTQPQTQPQTQSQRQQQATPQKQTATTPQSTSKSSPAPKAATSQKATSPKPSTKKATTTNKAPIAVNKPSAKAPASGSSKPKTESNDIGWDDPGPILSKPSSSSGGSGSSSASSGGPARVGSSSAGGNSTQNRAASSANVSGAGGSGNLNSSARSGGGGGLAGVDALPEPDMSPYIANVNAKIRRNWSPPEVASSIKAVYVLRISRSGSLTSLRMKSSSGNANFDAIARSAAQTSAPFPSLPTGFRGQFVDIEFFFDYNSITPR